MYNFKHILIFTATIMLMAATSTLMAGEESKETSGIKVTWHDFDDYRDVQAAMEPKGVFHERVKKSFDKFFKEYSEELPEGHSLAIEITDLDLAGHVLLGRVNQFRVMKDLYFPRMDFTYSLMDSSGKVVKEGQVKLKDMKYLYHQKTWKRYREGFYYEKRMFKEWFEDNILE